MADTPEVRALSAADLGKMILEPLNHGFAAGCRAALTAGVPTNLVLEMLMNHLASIVAMVEPPGAREECIKGVVRDFASLVTQHHGALQAVRKTQPRLLVPAGVMQ